MTGTERTLPDEENLDKAACDDWTKIPMHCAECGGQFLRKVRHQKYCDEHRHLGGAVIRPQEALTSTELVHRGRRRVEAEPETRVGICCGCNQDSMSLFKVPGIYRYRCAECFASETGYHHHLSPPAGRIVLP